MSNAKLKRYKIEIIDFDKRTKHINGTSTLRTTAISVERRDEIIKEHIEILGGNACYRWSYIRGSK